ncbi:MAG: T9SS type A sorting domain-containing protein, partial [Bacteroidetes bacterium]|nr:T9SS type A sorting domain-containing protein [Bacteroidota bacterium]
EINIYLNDDKFIYGGLTNQDPLMILKLRDESGINAVGTGVGRNISATLDGEKVYIVNEYYQSNKDDYKSGTVKYQLVGIADGKHVLKAKAWDVLNNSNETSTEFLVAQDATLIIKNLLNYPNPFTTNTTFHFDHNKPGDLLNVQLQILSITGQVIKNVYLDVPTDGSHFDNIQWDGKDEYGDKIGRGVYLYKMTVKSSSNEIATEQGKLVILN